MIEVRFKPGSLGDIRSVPAADWQTALRTMGAIMRKLIPEATIAREPYTAALVASYENADTRAHAGPWSVFACSAFAVQALDSDKAKEAGWR